MASSFGGCFAPEEDVIRTQLEQVFVAIIKAVFQAIGNFHFILDVALGRDQTLSQAGVQTAVEEVGQRNMLRLWYLAHRPLGQVTVSDNQVNIRRQVIDRAVGNRDVTQSGILHFLAQHPGTHGAGTHPGVAGDDDFTHMAQVVGDITGRQRVGAFGFRFHVMHTTRCGFDIVFFFYLAGLQQNRRDHEGDRHRCDNRGDVSEVGAFRRHRQHRQDRALGSRRDQTAIEDGQGEDTGHPAEDNGQGSDVGSSARTGSRFHGYPQEVDDSRPAC